MLVTLGPRGHLWGRRLHPPAPGNLPRKGLPSDTRPWTHLSQRWVVTGGLWVSPPPASRLPPPQIHQRTVSRHQETGLRLDLPKNILCFTDVGGLVFGDHT